MFTEGLDQSALNWIKQGSEVDQHNARSPLTENTNHEFPLARSPLSFHSSIYMSSHGLPPLKSRHSALLIPHNKVTLSLDSNDDGDDDDDESVASAPNWDGSYSEEEDLRHGDVDTHERTVEKSHDQEMFGPKKNTDLTQRTFSRVEGQHKSNLNKGLLMEDLRIEVPEDYRRYTDGELGFVAGARQNIVSGGSCGLRERVQLHNAYGTPTSSSKQNPVTDLGTPSAPPIIDTGREGNNSESESESIEDYGGGLTENERNNGDGIKEPEDGFNDNKEGSSNCRVKSPKDEHVERECMEAPEFLRDECLVLRSAFG
ncbi:hypothetical protein U1Q18_000968 [Sarracenia purpurea var. burkii]